MSIPIGKPFYFLNAVSPIVKKHLLLSYETALLRAASVIYLFLRPLDARYKDVEKKY